MTPTATSGRIATVKRLPTTRPCPPWPCQVDDVVRDPANGTMVEAPPDPVLDRVRLVSITLAMPVSRPHEDAAVVIRAERPGPALPARGLAVTFGRMTTRPARAPVARGRRELDCSRASTASTRDRRARRWPRSCARRPWRRRTARRGSAGAPRSAACRWPSSGRPALRRRHLPLATLRDTRERAAHLGLLRPDRRGRLLPMAATFLAESGGAASASPRGASPSQAEGREAATREIQRASRSISATRCQHPRVSFRPDRAATQWPGQRERLVAPPEGLDLLLDLHQIGRARRVSLGWMKRITPFLSSRKLTLVPRAHGRATSA